MKSFLKYTIIFSLIALFDFAHQAVSRSEMPGIWSLQPAAVLPKSPAVHGTQAARIRRVEPLPLSKDFSIPVALFDIADKSVGHVPLSRSQVVPTVTSDSSKVFQSGQPTVIALYPSGSAQCPQLPKDRSNNDYGFSPQISDSCYAPRSYGKSGGLSVQAPAQALNVKTPEPIDRNDEFYPVNNGKKIDSLSLPYPVSGALGLSSDLQKNSQAVADAEGVAVEPEASYSTSIVAASAAAAGIFLADIYLDNAGVSLPSELEVKREVLEVEIEPKESSKEKPVISNNAEKIVINESTPADDMHEMKRRALKRMWSRACNRASKMWYHYKQEAACASVEQLSPMPTSVDTLLTDVTAPVMPIINHEIGVTSTLDQIDTATSEVLLPSEPSLLVSKSLLSKSLQFSSSANSINAIFAAAYKKQIDAQGSKKLFSSAWPELFEKSKRLWKTYTATSAGKLALFTKGLMLAVPVVAASLGSSNSTVITPDQEGIIDVSCMIEAVPGVGGVLPSLAPSLATVAGASMYSVGKFSVSAAVAKCVTMANAGLIRP